MERFTFFEGGKWRFKIGDTDYSGKIADRLAAFENLGCEPEEIKNELAASAFPKQDLVAMLERLVNSPSSAERCTAASLGYGLERLVYDEAFQVRCECARHGAGVDILVNDPEPAVRAELVKQGCALEKLMHDKNAFVRSEVVARGYKLDEMIKDRHALVRWNVVRQGFGLDLLSADKDKSVRLEVRNKLKEIGVSLNDWIQQNPEKCALEENRRPCLDAVVSEADRIRDAISGRKDVGRDSMVRSTDKGR